MDRNFERALPHVLKHEGGFVNHPNDPGGATNKGVTLATFRRYVKTNGTVADLKAITDAQVATVYYRHYWAAVNAQALPSGVDYAVFDFAVNSGPDRAVKYLQAVLGVSQDGRVGPKTIAAAQAANARDVIDTLCDNRLAFMKRIKNRKTGQMLWPTFGKGWTRRVAEVRALSLSWVGDPADIKRVPVPTPKPVVPHEVEDEARKTERNSWWQWLFALPAAVWAPFADNPWLIAALLAVVAVTALVALIGGRRLVRRIKDIREEIAA